MSIKILAFLLLTAGFARSATFTVTNPTDALTGSLRWAIEQVNARPGNDANEIRFNLAGNGPHVINLASQLPHLTRDNTRILGDSQPGYAGQPLIALNGHLLFPSVLSPYRGVGLAIYGHNCEVVGLAFGGFSGGWNRIYEKDDDCAIRLHGNNGRVQACYFGCDTLGLSSTQMGHPTRNLVGIRVFGHSASIVNSLFVENRVSIYSESLTADHLLISTNIFGQYADGRLQAQETFGFFFPTSSIFLQQCDYAGLVEFNTFASPLGSLHPGGRLSGSHISVSASLDVTARGLFRIYGNTFGLKLDGTASSHGTSVVVGRNAVRIGAGEADLNSRNFFAGAEDLMIVAGGTDFQISGNVFGENIAGQPRPSPGTAIGVFSSNFTGTSVIVSENKIRNCGAGITTGGNYDRSAQTTQASRNTFVNISGMAIDNGANGPTPWDVFDADTGPSGLQNQPILDSISYNPATDLTTVQGRLFSLANQTYRIELFGSFGGAAIPPEAHLYLNAVDVTTGNGGEAVFSIAFSGLFSSGAYATATATQTGNYAIGVGGTSELSDALRPPTGSFRLTGGGSLTEGDGLSRTLTVTRSNGSYGPVNVSLLFNTDAPNGNASDYTLSQGPVLNFAHGETVKTITVMAVDDTSNEDPELFTVTLGNLVGGRSISGQAVISIFDNDPLPSLSVADVTVTEGQQASVRVQLSAASGKTISVAYDWLGGTAGEGSDFGNVARGVLTFIPGQTFAEFSADTFDDVTAEGTEVFFFALALPVNATISQPLSRITIIDNDVAPATTTNFSWFTVAPTVPEAGQAGFTHPVIRRTGSLSGQAKVKVSTVAGSAQGTDFTPVVAQEVVFENGQEFQSIAVALTNDTIWEYDERFYLDMHDPTSASGTVSINGESWLAITIQDDDLAPQATVIGLSGVEGDSGFSLIPLQVKLSAPCERFVAVHIEVTGGTADAEDGPQTPLDVAIWPGQTEAFLHWAIYGDYAYEPDETIILTPTIVDGATGISGTLTVLNDDPFEPTLSLEDLPTSIPESQDVTPFTLRRSGDLTKPVSCTVKIGLGSNRTSIDGETFSFEPGEETQVIRLLVIDDGLDEADEQVTIIIVPNIPAVAPVDAHFLLVVDDDDPPVVSFALPPIMTERDTAPVTENLDVQLSAPSGLPVSLTLKSTDGTATAGADYLAISTTLTFAPGELLKTIPLTALPDRLDEADETFTIASSFISNATLLNPDPITITIIDNDTPLRPYRDWLTSHFTPAQRSNATTIDPCGDPDRDGLSNGLEFFLNSNPNSATSGPERITLRKPLGSSSMLWSFTGKTDRADFVTLTPQKSKNLDLWENIPFANISISDDLLGNRTYKIDSPLEIAPKTFFRILSGCREVEP